MVRFEQTALAIEDLEARAPSMTGVHTLLCPTVSVHGLDIGTLDYDPSRHQPHMIDPLSPMRHVYGREQVRLQLPSRPLFVNVFADYRHNDVDIIGRQKEKAIRTLADVITAAIPSMDLVETYDIENYPVDPPIDAQDEAAIVDESITGLSLLISDFSRFSGHIPLATTSEVIAIKVNHPSELQVPPGVGRLSIGNLFEVDTNNPGQLVEYNQALDRYHQKLDSRLRDWGVTSIVQVELLPTSQVAIDTVKTDKLLAVAVRNIR